MSEKKYKITGFFFSLALALTYLPLWLGISDMNEFCNIYAYCTQIIISLLGTVFFTLLNFLYIVKVKINKIKSYSCIILPITNIVVLFTITFILAFYIDIEGNVFIFSLLFLFFPWFIIISIFSHVHHRATSKRINRNILL